ncbi:MAG: AzlD domain-containing protein [Burkholderiales bacterium]|jgi:branched-subunit amino acid transport protein|nr:AzlD domain-containing protein [Burkholderiales bacterium]
MMTLLILMIVCGVLTFLMRFSFIATSRFFPQSSRFYDLLRYVPPAIFAALIAPDIFWAHGETFAVMENPRLIAAAVAFVVAFFFRNVLLTIAVGMLVLWGVS